MKQVATAQVKIADDFWKPRLSVNAEIAIYHQWEQLEKTGCIENFRLVADGKEGFREGYFFADSDAFKWLDAAARVYLHHPSEKLKTLMDDFIALIGRAQTEDGYLYTYNQFHFPEVRWANFQIEHELYCHGHLIEAAVSHLAATNERTLLAIGTRTADLLVREFASAGPEATPGHEEIEIALIRLFEVTQEQKYLDLAEHFIEQRGRIRWFLPHILGENSSVEERGTYVNQAKAKFDGAQNQFAARYELPEDNATIKPPLGTLRMNFDRGTGKYFQQHKPVREQTVPVGHAVRFTYLETAVAMLYRYQQDEALLTAVQKAWDHMVSRRMYVTGGIGSLPNTEGFGRDYELPPKYSYAETCAALGNIFWSWQMSLITGEAKYADLTEWQLYNASAVGLGQDGVSYTYNNPLYCEGGFARQAWFKCPCCPSNISRMWADLGQYIYSFGEDEVWVHQYVGSEVLRDQGPGINLEAGLPWDGKVKLILHPEKPVAFTVHCRVPSWAGGLSLWVNGNPVEADMPPAAFGLRHAPTASGYDPRESWYLPIRRVWNPGDTLEIEFEMAINLRATHPGCGPRGGRWPLL